MPITTSKPLIADGNTYPNLTVQMIISPRVEVADVAASVVINLIPYRIKEDNTIETRPEAMRTVLMSDAFAMARNDPHVAQALGTIMYAVQEYITAKEL